MTDAQAAIRDTASQLWLMVTGRVPFETAYLEGDTTALNTMQRALALIPSAL